MSPRVTVLMSVYNGQGFLRPAIQSILNQTFTDFEFLIIDDGSTDDSVEIVRAFPDRRIKLLLNGSNLGLIDSLNKGLGLAASEYIARMDADDISLPTRLERQMAFMDTHPKVGVCGSWLETCGIPPISRWCPPADDARIRCEHLFHSDIYHPTVMLRKDFFAQHNLTYNKQMTHAEDYDLWVRAGRVMQLANIPEILLHHRIHRDSVGTIYADGQYQCSQDIRTRQLRELGIEPSDEEIRLHARLSLEEFEPSREFVKRAEQWLLKVQLANMNQGLFPEPVFSQVLANKWFELCNSVAELGFWAFRKFSQSPLKSPIHLPWKTQTKFLIKCVVKRPATLPGKSAPYSKNG